MKKKLLSSLFALGVAFSLSAQITVSADITSNTTWTSNNIYVLTGSFIYVTNNATLTIEPGTLIKGDATTPGALVITRGSKIIADGTPTRPIVFTSGQPAGSRGAGDWGSLLILGKAPINDPAGERLGEGGIDPVKGLYGGTDPNDNSGILRYVRIEFGGIAYQPNNETNGLTFGAVGAGTIVDHVQVSFGGDDAFEWFGGTVNCKHLIANRTLDDMFDTDYGFSGHLQFVVGLSDSLIADVSGSNGFESDNDGSGTTNAPLTHPIVSNVSMFGPKKTASTTINSNYKRGGHLRRSGAHCVYNSLITGFPTGLKIDGTNTGANVNNKSLQFKNNIIAGCPEVIDSTGMSTTGTGSPAWTTWNGWLSAYGNTSLPNSMDVMAVDPYNYTNPNFLLQTGSPALTGADFSSPNLTNSFYTVVNYRGAFDGVDDWTKCWANWDPQNESYSSAGIDYLPVSVSASGATTLCQGGSVTLTATSALATSFVWSTNATTSAIVVNSSGNYNVTVMNANGCSATTSMISVVVNPLPTVSVTVTGPTVFCTGDSTMLCANSSSSYLWSNAASTQCIYVKNTGNYTAQITDANGCTSSSSSPVNISVSSSPVPTINASGSTTICPGSSLTLTSSLSDSYTWSTGATTQAIVVSSAGTYSVTVTNSNPCNGSGGSDPVIVSISSVPTALFTYVASLPSVTFTNASTGGAASYSWNFGDASSSSVQNPTHTFANGTYTVCMTAYNALGCASAATCQTVNINTGIDEISTISSFNLYPNPMSNETTIEFSLLDNAEISIMLVDLTGKVVFSVNDKFNQGANTLKIDASEIPNGFYFTRIITNNSSKTIKTIVLK